MSGQVGLQDKKKIPCSAGPVMNMNSPCIVGKIAPVIFKNPQLHEDHRDDHPFVKAFIFIHDVDLLPAKQFLQFFFCKHNMIFFGREHNGCAREFRIVLYMHHIVS